MGAHCLSYAKRLSVISIILFKATSNQIDLIGNYFQMKELILQHSSNGWLVYDQKERTTKYAEVIILGFHCQMFTVKLLILSSYLSWLGYE